MRLSRFPLHPAVAAGAALLVMSCWPATAGAQSASPCPPPARGSQAEPAPKGIQCGRISVPLDHSGQVAGTVRLSYARIPAEGAKAGTIVVLTGGPGEAAIPAAGNVGRLLGPIARRYDVVLLDQRGSGASDPVACASRLTPASVADCAQRLGTRRPFWTTRETAADIDDLRRALGEQKLTVFGISYGAKVAGEYARRFPSNTASVILDSPAPVDGLDTSYDLRQFGLPRVLREICFPPGCEGFAPDPTAAVGALVERLQRGPLRGRIVLPSGRTRAGRVVPDDLYSLVLRSDLDPVLRAELPAAVASGLRGDAAPLLRVLYAASRGSVPAEEQINTARFLATTCVEGRLPWAPESPLEGREAALLAGARATPQRFAPFGSATVIRASIAAACLSWPSTPRPEGVLAQGPNVPVLVLSGREDLRTPLEDARRTAGQYPAAQLLAVPGVGHSVLASDLTRCARDGISAFLSGRPVARCSRRVSIPRAPFIPASLVGLPRLPGVTGSAGRTATAVSITLGELARLVATGAASPRATRTEISLRVPGLRGGNAVVSLPRGDARSTRSRIAFHRFEVIRGVRITGTFSDEDEGILRVSAPGVTGTLTQTAENRLQGSLNGQAVVLRLPG